MKNNRQSRQVNRRPQNKEAWWSYWLGSALGIWVIGTVLALAHAWASR